MILNARDLQTNAILNTQLCIVGAGAAGITLAMEYAEANIPVILVESGGLEFDPKTQSLYKGFSDNAAYPALEHCRLRYFGGTTNHWGGNCSPLDAADFEIRDWVPYSGWPISRDNLNPFYVRAQTYCQLGPFEYGTGYWSRLRGQSELALNSEKVISKMAQASPPTRFGQTYRKTLQDSASVTVLLNANLTKLEPTENGNSITSIQCSVLNGESFTIHAKQYVLAMGAIENARMLLHPTKAAAKGTGNQSGNVGRFFMDHPVIEGALFIPTNTAPDLSLYQLQDHAGHRTTGYFQIAKDLLATRQLLNVRMPISPVSRYRVSDGIESYHRIAKSLGDGKWPDKFAQDIGTMASDISMVVEAMSRYVFGAELFDSANESTGYVLDTMIEPVPNPDNRITLSTELDELGLRKAKLNWQTSARDRENLWSCFKILGEELGRIGAGRMRLLKGRENELWNDGRLVSYGCHHIGTTRAHSDPARGVVDKNLKMHYIDNLYIAGSSVFTTAGHVPPTLTIVALAVRLAEYLKSKIS